ncbi:MAG: hypothetical protein ACLR6B_20585 [Blautia sp.]
MGKITDFFENRENKVSDGFPVFQLLIELPVKADKPQLIRIQSRSFSLMMV